MARCTNTSNLRLLHRSTGAGPGMENIKVYCKACYEALVGKGRPDESIADVSPDTRDRALMRSGNRCECTSSKGCH